MKRIQNRRSPREDPDTFHERIPMV
jgi:hypothetical protein